MSFKSTEPNRTEPDQVDKTLYTRLSWSRPLLQLHDWMVFKVFPRSYQPRASINYKRYLCLFVIRVILTQVWERHESSCSSPPRSPPPPYPNKLSECLKPTFSSSKTTCRISTQLSDTLLTCTDHLRQVIIRFSSYQRVFPNDVPVTWRVCLWVTCCVSVFTINLTLPNNAGLREC